MTNFLLAQKKKFGPAKLPSFQALIKNKDKQEKNTVQKNKNDEQNGPLQTTGGGG